MNEVLEAIDRQIHNLRLPLNQIAKHVGISEVDLTKYLTGITPIPFNILLNITDLLEMDLRDYVQKKRKKK